MANRSARQSYAFGFSDSAAAEAGGVPLDALHRDVGAILKAFDAIASVAERLGVPPPKPRLAGFAYNHVSALGAQVVFAKGSEPNVLPAIRSPRDIDRLREPEDYFGSGIVPSRLRLAGELKARRPDASGSIGHPYEGPVTTAVLLMGEAFLTLPYDDPARARRLLRFCTDSAVNFACALAERDGVAMKSGPRSIPDDFAGMFPPPVFEEFVVPEWERMYEGLEATERHLHSELLRPAHLKCLADLRISEYDPSADQYLTPEILAEKCPVRFTGRIQSWHIRDLPAEDLRAMYRRIAACRPTSISFYMTSLCEERKIGALLETAREFAR